VLAIEIAGGHILFLDRKALLLVLARSGEDEWAMWGKPYGVEDKFGPKGGLARHESIAGGVWIKWWPRLVKIPATAFMELADDGCQDWFPIDSGLVIQGATLECRTGSGPQRSTPHSSGAASSRCRRSARWPPYTGLPHSVVMLS